MCGIVGYVGTRNALDVVIKGLEYLEYRGYDSAGVAIRTHPLDDQPAKIVCEKAVGKLAVLKAQLSRLELRGEAGMGHTRWATHGVPSFHNAHPHRYGKVTLVHNGILENHKVIRQRLLEKGHAFYSDTDTEVAAHLLDLLLKEQPDPILAISALADTIHGAYALGIMLESDTERMYFAKNGSPLIVASGDGESFFASDQAALVDYQPMYHSLEDGEIGFIARRGVEVFDLS
ncbi:MAG TPA: glutamine--fructose-6-phosphate aminotransferase, partial [Myxococcota bacterium]|nr:glutamine--fructose-6-phosphate aminotransferase [Myxococcota bacterium]